jgi:hypothetical protein
VSVAIVVAKFNTRRLISQLIFSLYRLLRGSEFSDLGVVDNGSTDGSSSPSSVSSRRRISWVP